jgi:16S rRNA (guanine966-N2)-methyltransferase
MRVISGTAGGQRLRVPKDGVRPTTDRTKAAMFSWLNQGVVEARVLDLFAGTGGLGIEAHSRGAATADFVESSPEAVEILKKNLASTKLEKRARIHHRKAGEFLKSAGSSPRYDLIFCDPPWIEKGADSDWVGWILEQETLPPLLAEGGWFLLEAPSERRLDVGPLWRAREARRYGTTTVHFLRPAAWTTGGES